MRATDNGRTAVAAIVLAILASLLISTGAPALPVLIMAVAGFLCTIN